jgi:hypothetical protein
VCLVLVGGLGTWRVARAGRPYRRGPWPGLSVHGAGLLLGCALLLGGGLLVLNSPSRALPDLPILTIVACAPLALATRFSAAPGAASAVCGAYLLPRTLLSLVDPTVDPPPLLLVPAVAFDLTAWLRPSDLAGLLRIWPRKRSAWRARDRRPRRLRRWRAAAAGAMFGAVLAAVEPPFAVLLGGDRALWSGTPLLAAAAYSALGCAIVGLAVSARDTAR